MTTSLSVLTLVLLGVCQWTVSALQIPGNPGSVIAQYWPAYEHSIQSVSQFPFANTDIAYYFVVSTISEGLRTPNAIQDGEPTEQIAEFVQAAHANGVKASVTIGGWTSSKYFSSLTATAASRAAFAAEIVDFTTRYGFDGADIDWEYPGRQANAGNQVSPSDSADLLLLLAAIRALTGDDFILTAAVSLFGFADQNGQPLIDLSPYATYLNYVNLMAYDITGPWAQTTGPNSPLANCNSGVSVASGVQLWINAGFKASKILLGIPAYGVSFTTVSATLTPGTAGGFSSLIYQQKTSPAGPRVCGDNCEYGTLINTAISPDGMQGVNGFTRYWDTCSSSPFVFNPTTRELITYEDPQSIRAKTAYVTQIGLAGVFIFDSLGFTSTMYSAVRNGLPNFVAGQPPMNAQLAVSPSVVTPSFNTTKTTTTITFTTTTATTYSPSVATSRTHIPLTAAPVPSVKPAIQNPSQAVASIVPYVSGFTGAAILCPSISSWQFCTMNRCAPEIATPIGVSCINGALYWSDQLPTSN